MSGFTPENSRIQVTKSLQERVDAATSAVQIAQIMHEEALAQKLVVPENDPSILTEVVPGTAPRKFAEVITDPVTGEKRIFEGNTEAEALKGATEYMKTLFAKRTTSEEIHQQEQPRGAGGKFISQTDKEAQEAEAVRLAELESAYKTGQITLAQYVKASGIVEQVQAEQQQTDTRVQQSWKEATDEFLQTAGNDYPGGEENQRRMFNALVELGLTDNPSAESLAKAYQYLVENDKLAENPELTLQQRIAEATTPEQLRAILGYRGEQVGRDLWGR